MKDKKKFVTTWSKWNSYAGCPWQFWLIHGSKYVFGKPIIPFKSSVPLEEGNTKHALQEKHLRAYYKGAELPENHVLWREDWRKLLKGLVASSKDVLIEQKLAVDIKFKKAVVIDKYYNIRDKKQTVLFQGALDAVGLNGRLNDATTAVILDWKSGKVRPDKGKFDGQLATQAAMLFCVLPNIKKITAFYVFLDHMKQSGFTYTRKDLPTLKDSIQAKCHTIWHAIDKGSYPKTPKFCGWCPATHDQCEHGRI